jgi:hypothetical protein
MALKEDVRYFYHGAIVTEGDISYFLYGQFTQFGHWKLRYCQGKLKKS